MPDIRRSAGIALMLLLQNDHEGALEVLNQHPLKLKDGEPWIELEEEHPPATHQAQYLLSRFEILPVYQATEREFEAALRRHLARKGFIPGREE